MNDMQKDILSIYKNYLKVASGQIEKVLNGEDSMESFQIIDSNIQMLRYMAVGVYDAQSLSENGQASDKECSVEETKNIFIKYARIIEKKIDAFDENLGCAFEEINEGIRMLHQLSATLVKLNACDINPRHS